MTREIKGWHVLTGFVAAFGIIISVNLVLAYQAVSTFPGLEVKNSYVASQSFDVDRKAQEALGWEVSATVTQGVLRVAVLRVVAGPGNWNLRIKLRAPDGTLFQQRVIVAHVAS